MQQRNVWTCSNSACNNTTGRKQVVGKRCPKCPRKDENGTPLPVGVMIKLTTEGQRGAGTKRMTRMAIA